MAHLALFASPDALAPARSLAPTQDPAGGTDGPIREVGESYIIQFAEPNGVGDGMTLEQFVKVCQESTGLNFTYTEETAAILRSNRVRMFGTKRIRKTQFYNFFQIMMFIHEFSCAEVGPDDLKVILVQSRQVASGRSGSQQRSMLVLPEDLQDYADQPAVLITTVVALKNTDARQVSTSLRPFLTDPNGQHVLSAGLSNSLLVTGFGSNVVHLSRILALIDEAAAVAEGPAPVFEVIPLEFASADDVVETVDRLLEANRRQREAQRSAGFRAERGPSAALQDPSSAEAELLSDARTNSLLVMALPDQMDLVKNLVARLDVDVVEPQRNFHVVALQNTSATEVAEVLRGFLEDSELEAHPAGPGGRSSGSRRSDVVVVPDPGTNSLLISAGRARYEEVLDLVLALDKRQDQVLIETALLELSGSTLFEIGAELGFADDIGSSGTGQFGVTSFGLSTIGVPPEAGDEVLPGLGGGPLPTRVPVVTEGFTAGILNGEEFALPLLIQLMERREDTNVLNVPSLLVTNNDSASVTAQDGRPTTTVTPGIAGGDPQVSFGGFESTGVTLSISPSISAARYLRLQIDLEVSNFAADPDPTDSIPPPIVARSISTVVNVPDGDTMVIGGIVTDNKREATRRAPLLGDVPLLGQLFRSDSEESARTTLYFFVTPHILRDEDFADLTEISYMRKLEAAEVIGMERVRIVDPSFGVDDVELDGLDSFELPLYRSTALEGSEADATDAAAEELARRLDAAGGGGSD